MSRPKPEQQQLETPDADADASKELPEIVKFGREVTREIFRVLDERMAELGLTNSEVMARAGISQNRFSKYRYSPNSVVAVHYLVLLSRQGGLGLTINEMLGRFGDQLSPAGTHVPPEEVEHEKRLHDLIYTGSYPLGPKRALDLLLLGLKVNDQMRAGADPAGAHAKPPQPVPVEIRAVRRGGKKPGRPPGKKQR